MCAVQQDGTTLVDLSEKFRNNRTIVREAEASGGENIMKYVSQLLRKEYEYYGYILDFGEIREKNHDINKAFVEWVWKPENRNKWIDWRLATLYN